MVTSENELINLVEHYKTMAHFAQEKADKLNTALKLKDIRAVQVHVRKLLIEKLKAEERESPIMTPLTLSNPSLVPRAQSTPVGHRSRETSSPTSPTSPSVRNKSPVKKANTSWW
jgi:hypothetical protein